MISWIQRYFQKHFRLVFIVVLIAIGLPMVVIYSAGGGGHGDAIKTLERPFFHVNLANAEQARRLSNDAQLSVFLRAGYQALDGNQLQQYALQRVAGIALADDLHLPQPSADQVAKFVTTLRAFQDKDGQFDQSAYTRFGDQLKSGAIPFQVADVNRVLRDDARVAELLKTLSGPGYLQPVDVKLQLTRADSVWTAQVASLDYTSFNPAINPSDADLKKFREENAFRYDVPARPRLSAVEFKAADFAPPGAPTEADLRAFYNANVSAFPVPPDAKKDAAPVADNFTKVRDQVEAALRATVSRKLASEAANQLTVQMYERKLKANSPQLAEFLAAARHTPTPIASFNPNNPPADKRWLGNYAAAISRLTEERFFTDPLPSPDGLVVLLWNENLPAYAPSLLEVREQVLADYRENEKRRLFIERGNALKAQLQAAAKSPNGFADKAAAEKLEVKSFASFTLKTPPADFPPQALDALISLDQGQVSSLVGTEDKGLLVYAQEKKLPDLTPANPRYAQIQSQFQALIAANGENAVLGELVQEELKKTSPAATP